MGSLLPCTEPLRSESDVFCLSEAGCQPASGTWSATKGVGEVAETGRDAGLRAHFRDSSFEPMTHLNPHAPDQLFNGVFRDAERRGLLAIGGAGPLAAEAGHEAVEDGSLAGGDPLALHFAD